MQRQDDRGIAQTRMLMGVSLALLILIISTGCAKKKNDISQVSPDAYLLKSDLTGCPPDAVSDSCAKTFSAVKTFMSADENLDATGVVPGFHADMGFVQFYVTEKELQVRRVGDVNKTPQTEPVVASFPITAHFDILRETNDFGEQTNKIIEDTKKPWNQRQYIRVDWGTNKVVSTKLSNIFSTEINEEGAQVVTPLKHEGSLFSFDVDSTITQTDSLDNGGNVEQVNQIGALRAHVKNTFLEVKRSDYRPYEMSNADFARFGYFRTYENFMNPDSGVTVSGRKLWANRYNVCENNASTAGRSCATGKIVYTLNSGFPDEYRGPARDVVKAWNKAFQKALGRTDDVVVLDESTMPEIGDTRYNMIAGIDEKVPTGLLGVSQTVNDPNTGETLSGRASVYLGTVRLEAGLAAEQFDILMGGPLPRSKPGGSTLQSAALQSHSLIDGNKLFSQIKMRDRILKMLNYTPSKSFSNLKASGVKSFIQSQVITSPGNATARRQRAFTLLGDDYDLSDPAWTSTGVVHTTNNGSLKDYALFGKGTQLDQLKSMNQVMRGIHTSEFIEPAVENFVKKFVAAHQGQPVDQIREELKLEVRQLVFYTTLIHEMGHNFGLRHNFAGSSDRKNYTDQYYSLEQQKQQLAPNDPKIQELSLDQESYDFSSVMDYAGGFYEALGGTGHYDDAAIRFAYNTSINKDGDPIAGKIHQFKFCTDHQVGEDLLCQRWDKGSNVTMTSSRLIDEYHRNYIFRNFRRDRANFGDIGAYLNRVLIRTMLPLRQVTDEFLYQLITANSVPAGPGQCDLDFLRTSIDAGEVANICDPQVVAAYAAKGVDISDWSKLVVFLLKDDLSGFRKDPTTYIANGLADLLLSNYVVSNYFIDVLGTPDPGLYYPLQDPMGNVTLEAVPPVPGGDDASLKAYFMSKGLSDTDAQAQVAQSKGNLVDLGPGPGAKFLISQLSTDGVFQDVSVMGFLFDKIAAVLIMGARGLPVQKYQNISLNTNMYFSPQTKVIVSGLINALVNNVPQITTENVVTRSGATVNAVVPASLNLNTKFYGILAGVSDLISDQDQEFSDKMRICTEGDQHCRNDLKLATVSFKGSNGQDIFKATQVPSNDSVVFNLVSKGQNLSKVRDQAQSDITNQAKLAAQIADLINGKAAGSGALANEKAFMDLLTAKAPQLGSELQPLYGAGKDAKGNPTLWQMIIDQGKDLNNADPGIAQQIGNILSDNFAAGDGLIAKELATDATLLKSVQDAVKIVQKDMTEINSLTYRVTGAGQILADTSQKLSPIEADAKLIRSMMQIMGVQ